MKYCLIEAEVEFYLNLYDKLSALSETLYKKICNDPPTTFKNKCPQKDIHDIKTNICDLQNQINNIVCKLDDICPDLN